MSVYNRFDPNDRWVSLLAQSGRRLQSAELNEIQSLALHRDKQMGDVIFGAGHIIEGGQIYVQLAPAKLAIIFPSKVYVDGIIHKIGEKKIPITGAGEEVIGLKIVYETITYEIKKELLDPAVGYANFGSPGMDRLIAVPDWVVNDPAAIPMYRIIDGQVVTAKVPPELEGFTPMLARRTHDTSGSFLVSGMDGFIEPAEGDYVTLVIEAGKAYVLGYEINRLVPTRIKLGKALESRRVFDEVKYYNGTDIHSLSSKPVKAIQEVTAMLRLDATLTYDGSSLYNPIGSDAVVDIYSIEQLGKTFVKGKDYKLTDNSVDWSIGTTRPANNVAYQVKYDCMKKLTQGVDYKLLEGTNELMLTGSSRPILERHFNVTYDYYLSRRDAFYLTADGQIQIVTGQSDINPPAPPVPPDILALGELHFSAGGLETKVVNNKPKRLTMLELRSLLDRLERAEYNQAMLELDRTAQITDQTTNKKGIFTDNFTNFERADLGFGFDAMIDPANQTLQLPVNQLFIQMEFESGESVRQHERLLTLDYTEEVIIDQSYGTESLNINPYQVFGSQATIRLTPSQDSWVETSYVYETVWGWWDAWWSGNRTETRVILDENIPYIRQRVVTVHGEGFEPNCDNLQATFDGVNVQLVPADGSAAGTKNGTVKANGAGKFTATFIIPENIRTGTREVRIYNYV
ncbi:DUF4815 domain-containing protein [Paenibacillus sp. NEAU-GSW1]|uniref:DUF4815 domain-containing protein n=1 Tax=Paenibacillus sp. NEAU-GSW1 TaxID=2682486 RepID=UPI0012E19194|nr:DUF4815 domain-containing protein [Paenibacillus sp. NEAU-GSW1]MUT65325.1 DUF4815 domain-containing protein [Paenibacillus sp. NEAU-GSW1]